MSFICDGCSYDWGTPSNVARHKLRGDCEVNLRIRGHVATGFLQGPYYPVGDYLDIVLQAGLECFTSAEQPGPCVLQWVYVLCTLQWVSRAFKVMLLEDFARRPATYLKLNRRPELMQLYVVKRLQELKTTCP